MKLSDANLFHANLIGAKLRNAILISADLRDADLSVADAERARFENNQGISEKIKHYLIRRGAIFVGEPPNHDSRVLVRI